MAAGLLGTVLGVNRTMKSRENESSVIQSLATVMGILLITLSVYSMFTAGGSRYLVPFMLILGLSLCARWLEGIPVAAVLVLILGLAILYVISHGGMPHSLEQALQRQNARKLVLIAALVIGGTVLLMVSTVEKLVDFVLNILGQGLVVTALSVVGVVHSAVILWSGSSRGLMRYL
jgi:uncharacterized SAM-binding protein YcdF (DUF218 family)